MTIQAIQTEYKSYKFRSRLEARWAVFLDELAIVYDYEPEGFDLGEWGYYLPDFYLPEKKLWLEIKPDEPTHEEKKKAQAFAELSNQNIAIVQGRVTAPVVEYYQGYEMSVDSTTYSATVYMGALTDEYVPITFWRFEDLPVWLRMNGIEAPDFDGSIECARALQLLNLEAVLKNPLDAQFAPIHSYGIRIENLLWALHPQHGYTLRWNTIGGDSRYAGGKLPFAYKRAQQARFEHGETLR